MLQRTLSAYLILNIHQTLMSITVFDIIQFFPHTQTTQLFVPYGTFFVFKMLNKRLFH